jgi:hypothetical protein
MFKLDELRKEELENAIKSNSSYTLQRLLMEHELWNSPMQAGRQMVMKCPFHPDASPSFFINDETRVCYCQSCGAGGGYTSFSYKLHKDFLKSGLGYYSVLQNILSKDPSMQVQLGFSSIFISTQIRDIPPPPVKKVFKPSRKPVIKDFSDLSSWMKKTGRTSEEEIVLASLFVQQGMAASEIYAELSSESQVAVSLDINELLGGLSG